MDVLETVNVLFTQSPYIVILAIDDNIIVKAVDRNLNQKAQLEINGRDYLRNMIHLPFYMQDQSIELLKRQKERFTALDKPTPIGQSTDFDDPNLTKQLGVLNNNEDRFAGRPSLAFNHRETKETSLDRT